MLFLLKCRRVFPTPAPTNVNQRADPNPQALFYGSAGCTRATTNRYPERQDLLSNHLTVLGILHRSEAVARHGG